MSYPFYRSLPTPTPTPTPAPPTLQGAVKAIPMVAFHTFTKRYERPDASEGFGAVYDVPFVPRFESDGHKNLFLKHLT
jgi:hypothetical protein